ncbi:MAG TPA: histidine kinase dimerization/phosphoacceptor domain -containing protein [Chitinophagaceae bacterium]
MKRVLIQATRPMLLVGFGLLLQHFTSQAQLLQGIAYVRQDEAPSLKRIIATTKSTNEKVTALIRLGSLYFHDPYPHLPNLNSAMQLANEASKISSAAGFTKFYNDAQFLIANIYLRKYWPDSAAKVLLRVNDSTRLKILLGMSHIYRISQSEDSKARLKKAMDLTLQAQGISRNIHDTLLAIMVRREIACIHSDTQQPNSEKELLDVIRLLQGLGYPYLHYTYYELSGTAMLEGNEDKMLYYIELTLNSMRQTRDSLGAADWLLSHAIISRLTGQHEKSLSYANQAIQLYKTRYGDGNIAIAIRFLAEAMVKLKKQVEVDNVLTQIYNDFPPFDTRDSLQWFRTLGSVYRLMKEYAKAEPYHKMRIALQQRIHDKPDYYGLGQLYVEAGQFAKAKPYLENALKQVDSSYSMRTLGHLHYCLFLADSATGDYISAIRHLSKNKRYDDTLMKQSKVEAIEKYKAQFETERKEADLKLKDQRIDLLTKEQALKDMDLKRIRFLKNTALIGSLVLLAMGIVFYRLYQRKRKDSDTIARANEQLKDMLAEKEWWLKEVHHRVKNNLHTIICLLESQAMYLEKDALQAIEKSQHRIYAMSLIHQKLYQNEDLQVIDMSIYLEEFIGYLKDSFDTDNIEFIIKVEPVQLNLQQAIPVALIINEGVTNAIKYAFENEADAKIWISMTETDGIVRLMITDNGRGFELSEDNERKSLGMQLIRGLSKELKGTVLIESKQGTRLSIVFKQGPLTDKIPSLQEENIG